MSKLPTLLRRVALGGVALAALTASCTLTVTDSVSCTDDAACVSAFGDGYLCNVDGTCQLTDQGCTSSAECREREGFGFSCQEGLCAPIAAVPRCTRTYPDQLFSRSDFAEHLVIGNLMDRSVSTHQARENSAELAVRQAADAGGIEGRPIGIVFCTIEENASFDELERAEAAVASATWLTEELGVPAIVGPAASGDTAAVFEAIRDTGTLVISPSATSPALTAQDNTSPTDANPGLLWRTAPPDSLQGQVIAADMSGRGVSQVAVINQTGAYGDELVRVFEEEFGSSLIDIVKYDESSEIGDAIVTVSATAAEEVLFVSSQSDDVISFLNGVAATAAFDGKSIFLSDSAANADVIDGADPGVLARVRGTRPAAVSGPVFSAFQAGYAAEYSDDVSQFSFTAHAYDAAWLVLYGSAYATFEDGAVTGTGIAKGLRRISDPSGTEIEIRGSQWLAAVQAFRQGERLDVIGASGELDYAADTEETSAPIEVWRVVDDCAGGLELEVVDEGVDPGPKTCP